MTALALLLLGCVAPASLHELYDRAEAIAIGQVTERDAELAVLSVERWLRGGEGKTVRYRVRPSLRCDTSDAVIGERLLLFLERGRDGAWRIAWHGRGRREASAEEIAEVEQWLKREQEPSTFRVTTVTCEKCDLVAIGREHAPGDRFTLCRDGICMRDAEEERRPFVAEILDRGRFVGTARSELFAVTSRPAGKCRSEIRFAACTGTDPLDCLPGGEPETVATLPCAGFDGSETDTTGALPVSMLHCKQRRGIHYDDCLVVPKAGFDAQPPEKGVQLDCRLGEAGRLACARAATRP